MAEKEIKHKYQDRVKENESLPTGMVSLELAGLLFLLNLALTGAYLKKRLNSDADLFFILDEILKSI